MKRWNGHVTALLAWTTTPVILIIVACLVLFLVYRGASLLGPNLLFADTPAADAILGRSPVFDGIWPSLVGTLLLVLGASILAVPCGVLAGVHLAEKPNSRSSRWLKPAVDVLAGVPSIVMGLFGFGLILFLRQTFAPAANTSLLLAMGCLALLVLPYLVRTTETALRGLPAELRLAGPALGLTPDQSMRRILLPAARPGLLGGVLLAVGRIAEDTAVILMTGAVANSGMAGRLTGKFQALPFDIYYLAAEHKGPEDLHRAFATALVLLLLTSGLFFAAKLLVYKMDQKEGRSS